MKFWRVVYEIPTSIVVRWDYENISVTLEDLDSEIDIDRRDVYEVYTYAPNMVAAQFKVTAGLDKHRVITVEQVSFWEYLKELCIRIVYGSQEVESTWD